MRNVFLLTKIQFQGFMQRIMKGRKQTSSYFGVLFIVLFSILMIFVFASNAVTTMMQALELEKKGIENGHELAMFTSSSFSILMFLFVTLFRCVSPNKGRDEEILLSMPIKKREIISSRNVYNYIFDLSCFVIALLPNFIVYYIYVSGASFWIIVRGVALILVLPFLSNGLGSILSVFFSSISKKMKRYSLFQSVFLIHLPHYH